MNYPLEILKEKLWDIDRTIEMVRPTIEPKDLREVLCRRNQIKTAIDLIEFTASTRTKAPRMGRIKTEAAMLLLKNGETSYQISRGLNVSKYEVDKLKTA